MWGTLFLPPVYMYTLGTKSVGTFFSTYIYTGEKECAHTLSPPVYIQAVANSVIGLFLHRRKVNRKWVQKVSHEVTHLIIVHVYNWVSATLQYNQKEMRGHLAYCLENELKTPFPAVVKRTRRWPQPLQLKLKL